MTELVPPEDIEKLVGAKRHPTEHIARAVSAEQTVYILHSQQCLDSTPDLTKCAFSYALDLGIDKEDWTEDVPLVVAVVVRDGITRLLPATDVVGVPADKGHTFRLSVSSRMSSKVVGDLHHSDANWWSEPWLLEVRAWGLAAALEAAAALPLVAWDIPRPGVAEELDDPKVVALMVNTLYARHVSAMFPEITIGERKAQTLTRELLHALDDAGYEIVYRGPGD